VKVLIIDEVHEKLTKGLLQLGIEVDYFPEISPHAVMQVIGDYNGLVVRTKMDINQHVLSLAGKLKFVARAGSGLDNIDTSFCNKMGIGYFNAGEANADAVGEHTIAMLLSLFTKLQKANNEVKDKIWDRKGNIGWELKGKTIGIIGFGNTGKAVAKKLSGFEVNVLAYDKYLINYGNQFATQASLEQIQATADIISFHVPLTDETCWMVNENWILQNKKPIVLLNLSRGKVVKLNDAIKALQNNKLKAAAFDVLEDENVNLWDNRQNETFEKLSKMENVILSPHIAGWTIESFEKISLVLLQKIKELTFSLNT